MTEPEYIRPADCAKLIRRALRDRWPGVKFSVRTDVYSMGSSVRISYTGGPDPREVEAVAGEYTGVTFDGMTDSTNHHTSQLDGRTVRYGLHHAFAHRTETAETAEPAPAAPAAAPAPPAAVEPQPAPRPAPVATARPVRYAAVWSERAGRVLVIRDVPAGTTGPFAQHQATTRDEAERALFCAGFLLGSPWTPAPFPAELAELTPMF